jgi:hypothetical protein
MAGALGPAAVVTVAFVLCVLTHPEAKPLTRRAFARLFVWAGAGLSLVAGCGSSGGYEPPDSLLRKWARVGWAWREMSAHRRHERGGHGEGLRKWWPLFEDMAKALDALPAWPELRVVFEERWNRLDTILYQPYCYLPFASAVVPAAYAPEVVERQVEELEELQRAGNLTEKAVRKAAEVLAIQAERLARPGQGKGLAPTAEAELAGKRLTELTIDQLGRLAGPPRRNEGMPPPTCYAPPAE